LGLKVATNQLNRKQYASQGKAYELGVDWFSLDENLVPGSTSVLEEEQNSDRQWIRARARLEQYFKTGFFSTGYLVEGVFSNQPLFSNYQASMINAPAFLPLQDSRTLVLPNFRAFNYIAGGLRNVFAIRPNIDVRLEGYAFKPFEALREGSMQNPELMADFSDIYFAATCGIVMHSTVGPISLNFNYYDQSPNRFGALLHVGFLLFQKQSME
jgi:NTE family protein